MVGLSAKDNLQYEVEQVYFLDTQFQCHVWRKIMLVQHNRKSSGIFILSHKSSYFWKLFASAELWTCIEQDLMKTNPWNTLKLAQTWKIFSKNIKNIFKDREISEKWRYKRQLGVSSKTYVKGSPFLTELLFNIFRFWCQIVLKKF